MSTDYPDRPAPLVDKPGWSRWLDDRHIYVQCIACHSHYHGTYFSPSANKGKGGLTGGVPKMCPVCARRRREAKRKALPMDKDLIAAVRVYARANYDEDGWDYIEESYEDKELWEVIAGAKTPEQAIRKARAVARMLNERREDIQATAW